MKSIFALYERSVIPAILLVRSKIFSVLMALAIASVLAFWICADTSGRLTNDLHGNIRIDQTHGKTRNKIASCFSTTTGLLCAVARRIASVRRVGPSAGAQCRARQRVGDAERFRVAAAEDARVLRAVSRSRPTSSRRESSLRPVAEDRQSVSARCARAG